MGSFLNHETFKPASRKISLVRSLLRKPPPRRGWVVTDSQAASSVSGGCRGRSTSARIPPDDLPASRFHHGVSSNLRCFEMHGDGLVAPGIVKLVAAISNIDELHVQLARRFFEAARLVAQFRG